MTNWRTVASTTSGSTKIQNVDSYLVHSNRSVDSPIDGYYSHRTRAITTATPEFLNSAGWLSGYIVASMVSATELYFRQIFSQVLSICPESQKLSSEQSVHMVAVLWHGREVFSLAAFEHLSFAGSEKIKKCSKDFLGFEIRKTSNTASALDEFDKLCELRHGIVHSGLVLPGKNAVKLHATKTADTSIIQFDVARIHEATAACTALVESYNAELYEEIVTRWATKWRRNAGWNPSDELSRLKEIVTVFFSDSNPPQVTVSPIKLRNLVKTEFGL